MSLSKYHIVIYHAAISHQNPYFIYRKHLGDELASLGQHVGFGELSKMAATRWHASQELRNDYIFKAETRRCEKRRGKVRRQRNGLKWYVSTPKQPRVFRRYEGGNFDNEMINNESNTCEIEKNDTILFVNYFKTAMAKKHNKKKDVTTANRNIFNDTTPMFYENTPMFYENDDYGIPFWFSPQLLEPSRLENE
ncbi:6341_t:CDS:1 [Paraglomus occultum]|uniref:6341_t:CDS:1 n=1 Tax=Paraglomus occultum TaxID=144539 RepID=A0A9N8WGZ0_9GLOM|nr:6341_t:CDS:1 [Paraglomus occultum]